MTIDQAIKHLRQYNKWRRSTDDNIPPPSPVVIGTAIDTLCDFAITHTDQIFSCINAEANPFYRCAHQCDGCKTNL